MPLPSGSKAGSASNKHKNSVQAGKQLAAVAQAAQKRSFLTKQKAQASPSTGAASTLAATMAAAIISPAAANPSIQPPPVVPPPVDPSPSASLPQQQTAAAGNVADLKGQVPRGFLDNILIANI